MTKITAFKLPYEIKFLLLRWSFSFNLFSTKFTKKTININRFLCENQTFLLCYGKWEQVFNFFNFLNRSYFFILILLWCIFHSSTYIFFRLLHRKTKDESCAAREIRKVHLHYIYIMLGRASFNFCHIKWNYAI